MSIVPFISDGLDKTVTAVSNDCLPEGELVFIHPLPVGLDAMDNASLDLHVGKLWRTHKGKDVTLNVAEDGHIPIPPRALVSIQTQESVKFPTGRFGYILPKMNLLGKGLTNAATKVDPGYSGHLIVNLSNLSSSTIKLKAGQAFCALVVHRVDPPANSYNHGPKSWPGVDQPIGTWRAIREWSDRNAGPLSLSGPVVTILLYLAGLTRHK